MDPHDIRDRALEVSIASPPTIPGKDVERGVKSLIRVVVLNPCLQNGLLTNQAPGLNY